jgi:two-component system, cell cycle sensor histidine kinase and response regulator CckA
MPDREDMGTELARGPYIEPLMSSPQHEEPEPACPPASAANSDELLARAFRSGPAPLAITRLVDGEILEVNKALEQLIGLRREEMIGRTTTALGLWGLPRREVMERVRQAGAIRDLDLIWTTGIGLVRTRTSMQIIDYRNEPCVLSLFIDETEKLRALDELRASEERYRTIVREATDAIVVVGQDGVYADVNEAACRLLGYTREEFTSFRPADIAVEDQVATQQQDIRRVLDGEGLRTERRLRAKDGRMVWVELTASRLPGGASQAILRDVTARREAEQQADRLLHLYAASADIDRAIGRIEDAATLFQEACRIAVDVGGFGLAWIGIIDKASPDHPVRLTASAGQPLGGRERILAALSSDVLGARRPGIQALIEDRVILTRLDSSGFDPDYGKALKDGGLQSSLVIPLHVSGGVVGAIAIYHASLDAFGLAEIGLLERIAEDVSLRLESIERELARRAVQTERDRLALAIDQASDGVMIIVPPGKIAYVNARFVEMTGVPADAAIGMLAADILRSVALRPDLAGEVHAAGAAQRAWSGEFDAVRADGLPYRISISTTPVRDELGRTMNTVAVMRDVTREHQLEEQLRQAQKMEAIGRLAGGIAHDFNNLLTAIGGYASLAKAQLNGSPAAEDVAAIEEAASRAADLTRQLLAFSRQTPISSSVVDLNGVVADLAPMLQRMIGETIDLVVKRGRAPALVAGDARRIEQAIMNLVVNSRDAMPDGGLITIETSNVVLDAGFVADHPDSTEGPHVLLSVTDVGSGIPPQILDRIFDPFFTTKEQGKGTGLGLSMVFGAVKACEGSIVVESAPARGTTFRIYFPSAPEDLERHTVMTRAGKSVSRGRDGDRGGRGRTVLIVEDEDAVRGYAVRVLEHAGFAVLQACNGNEAIEVANANSDCIDLVITDVVMPGLTGPQTVDQIRAICPDLPALLVSGYAELGVGGLSLERSIYLQKPFEAAALLEAIRGLLAASPAD